ncbi:hypothetical protein K402DRAFT_463536 [Aulographum hederae CBS 113979]|uniref:Autophagy-related protein 3 n=1 Tax=Aulographum hederae CBS 113979 TaxID=1176131 RepID=A0A6G1H075_9PEZI|nr:hypothetical protein K402DRAFT_463536 [Aulographum hederae CBS 113979]
MNFIHSALDVIRDKYAPINHNSTFRETGQITPEEFLHAGDYLVYKFPSWSWSDAASPAKRVAHLPPGKQFLVTRGVPCRRRLDANFAGEAGVEETVVRDGFDGATEGGSPGEKDDDGWLRTGGMAASQEARARDVRTVDESGNMGEAEADEDEIPDMEDEEDDEEAIIREHGSEGDNAPLRQYTIYITYTPYYRTPRIYLQGYGPSATSSAPTTPLPPHLMMEDIVGDYKDKTVTLEDFPYFDAGIKMASVHPCKHASVMKVLLDRADAAMKIRMAKIKRGEIKGDGVEAGMEGLVDKTEALKLEEAGEKAKNKGGDGEEWEVLDAKEEDDVAIRVDQYLVVFLKFMASVTPGIEHDFTMGM